MAKQSRKDFPELEDGYPDNYIKQKKLDEKTHISANQKIVHPLAYDAHYAFRGPAYISKHGGRELYELYSRYETIKPLLVKACAYKAARLAWHEKGADQASWEDKALFPEKARVDAYFGAKHHFDQSHKQFHPYKWQAHHLIPLSIFDETTKDSNGQPYFTDDDRAIIERSHYDINNGHNIMVMPARRPYETVHALLRHTSSHVAWTQKVAREVQQRLSNSLKEARSKEQKGKPHKFTVGELLRALYDLEEDLWSTLALFCRKQISIILAQAAQNQVPLTKRAKSPLYKQLRLS